MSNEVLNPPYGPIERLVNLINQKGAEVCDLFLVAGVLEDFLKAVNEFILRQSLKLYCFTNSCPFQIIRIGRLVSRDWYCNLIKNIMELKQRISKFKLVYTHHWNFVAQSLLSARLSGMGNKHLGIGMSKYILLGKPLGEFYIRWQSFHLFCLPFPDNFLFKFLKGIEENHPL